MILSLVIKSSRIPVYTARESQTFPPIRFPFGSQRLASVSDLSAVPFLPPSRRRNCTNYRRTRLFGEIRVRFLLSDPRESVIGIGHSTRAPKRIRKSRETRWRVGLISGVRSWRASGAINQGRATGQNGVRETSAREGD